MEHYLRLVEFVKQIRNETRYCINIYPRLEVPNLIIF